MVISYFPSTSVTEQISLILVINILFRLLFFSSFIFIVLSYCFYNQSADSPPEGKGGLSQKKGSQLLGTLILT